MKPTESYEKIDSVKFDVKLKKLTESSKKEVLSMIPTLTLSKAKEAHKFIYNRETFELENVNIKTADCYALLKDGTFGKIKKILVIDQKVFVIFEQSFEVTARKANTYQYILLTRREKKYIFESVHKIFKKVLFINEPLMACAFPNKIECD
jgi:hypothetical protein